MEKNRQYLLAGLVVVLVILVVAGGVFAYNQINEDDDESMTCTYNGIEYTEGENFVAESDDNCSEYRCASGKVVCINDKVDENDDASDTDDSMNDETASDSAKMSTYTLTQTMLDGSEGYDVFRVSLDLASGMTATLSDDGSKLMVKSTDLDMMIYTSPEGNGYTYEDSVPSNTQVTASGMNKELYRVQDQTLGYYYTDDFMISGTTKCDGWTSANPIEACASPNITFTNSIGGTENLYISCEEGVTMCDSMVKQMNVTVLK